MKERWSGLLYYTKKERRAIVILILVILVARVSNHFLDMWSSPEEMIAVRFAPEMAARFTESSVDTQVHVPAFDINKVTIDELVAYGLRRGVASTWIKYREARGGYTDQSQLFRIFGIDTVWLRENRKKFMLENKVGLARTKRPEKARAEIPPGTKDTTEVVHSQVRATSALPPDHKTMDAPQVRQYQDDEGIGENVIPSSKNRSAVHEEMRQVDINRSNVYEWQMLKGIGPVLAGRIIRFRQKLGGFHSIDQVAETYGLPDSTFSAIQPLLVHSPIQDHILINEIGQDSLANHPYIKWKEASIIIHYRMQHGPYESASDLYRTRVFDSTFVERISPYLDFSIRTKKL